MSYKEIGLHVWRDHATVMHSRDSVENWMDINHDFRYRIIKLFKTIKTNSMKETIQIIGKITGMPRNLVEDKFDLSERQLLEKGYNVVNPIKIIPPETSWSDSMRACLQSLLQVDAIAIQPDWYTSEGAKIEYMVANALKLKEVRL